MRRRGVSSEHRCSSSLGDLVKATLYAGLVYWPICITRPRCVNTLRPRQNGRRFPDDTFKRIFLNENVGIPIKISLKFVPTGPINNIPALVQIMDWRRPGDKPLSEPMMVSLPTHICITQPRCVKSEACMPIWSCQRWVVLHSHDLYRFINSRVSAAH